MTFEVSQSKLNTWRTCRNLYHYKYVMRLERKSKAMPLMRGTIVHEMLEAHYKGKNPWKPYEVAIKKYSKLFRVEREEYGDLPTDIKSLMLGYFSFYKNEDLKPLKVEYDFRVKLPSTKIFLVGKIDLIATSQGLKWITEHKCRNNIPSGSVIPYANLQASSYTWAYKEETGEKIDGVLWNDLWGKPATKPQMLKNGTMSKRHSSTTWPVYRQALIENNLEPSDYFDVKKQLKGNENQFYQRKFLPIDQRMTKSILDDTVITSLEIERLKGKDRTRNLGYHCDRCEMKDLCMAELKNLDAEFIIKAKYQVRDKT